MNPVLRASLAFALLSSACVPDDDSPGTGAVDYCTSLPPLTLSADASRIRVNQSLLLKASGGSGYYRYRAEPAGSSGQLNGSNFISGGHPRTATPPAEKPHPPPG